MKKNLGTNAELNFSLTFRHMEASPSVKSIATEKLTQRISKYYHGSGDVHLVLSVEKLDHVSEVHFVGDGIDMKAKASTGDMYSSIDKLSDILETQLRKRKDKTSSHRVLVDKSSRMDEIILEQDKLAA